MKISQTKRAERNKGTGYPVSSFPITYVGVLLFCLVSSFEMFSVMTTISIMVSSLLKNSWSIWLSCDMRLIILWCPIMNMDFISSGLMFIGPLLLFDENIVALGF
jgi:hypothetical protein